jgi:hypothetical protein
MGSPGITLPNLGPGGTPPILPGPSGADQSQQQQPQPEQLKQILQLVLKTQQQKTQPQMVPTGVQAQPTHLALPNMFGITSIVQGIYNHEKQKKIAEAKSDWNDLQVSMQKYIGQDGKVDPQAYSDPAVMQVLGNPKKLKEMAKALNQDWMNPEKTTVYGEALKASMAEQKQKHEAAAGLKQLFSHLIKRGQPTPQMDPDQQKQMASQVMSKAPISQGQPADMKEQVQLLTEMMKEQDADKRAAMKEEYDQYKADRKEQFDTWKTNTTQAYQESMERMRTLSAEKRESDREMTTLKALGIRLSAEDARKLSMTPAQMNTEVNSTLTSMRSQLTQASSQLKTLTTQAQTSKKWFNLWQSGVGDQQMKDAQSQVDNLKASIDYIEKNRAGIISGKASLDDVIDQAQAIAQGTPPGFK